MDTALASMIQRVDKLPPVCVCVCERERVINIGESTIASLPTCIINLHSLFVLLVPGCSAAIRGITTEDQRMSE